MGHHQLLPLQMFHNTLTNTRHSTTHYYTGCVVALWAESTSLDPEDHGILSFFIKSDDITQKRLSSEPEVRQI